MTTETDPLTYRFEDLDTWLVVPGNSLELLVERLLVPPNHGTDDEFDQWRFYTDRMLAALRERAPAFPDPQLRGRIERAMNRPTPGA
jgi:hypothetical protein